MALDLAEIGRPSGVKGVFVSDSFDMDAAARGEYVASMSFRTSVGRGTAIQPIQSVGANPRQPGKFYFATDRRFKNYPGFGCVWPAAPEVAPVIAVPVVIGDPSGGDS